MVKIINIFTELKNAITFVNKIDPVNYPYTHCYYETVFGNFVMISILKRKINTNCHIYIPTQLVYTKHWKYNEQTKTFYEFDINGVSTDELYLFGSLINDKKEEKLKNKLKDLLKLHDTIYYLFSEEFKNGDTINKNNISLFVMKDNIPVCINSYIFESMNTNRVKDITQLMHYISCYLYPEVYYDEILFKYMLI